jgi:hypothetical protein
MGRKPRVQKKHAVLFDNKPIEELQRDYELVIDGGSRRWLEQKAKELEAVWCDVIRMNQLTDVSIGFAKKNTIFIFKNQQVSVNIKNMFV